MSVMSQRLREIREHVKLHGPLPVEGEAAPPRRHRCRHCGASFETKQGRGVHQSLHCPHRPRAEGEGD